MPPATRGALAASVAGLFALGAAGCGSDDGDGSVGSAPPAGGRVVYVYSSLRGAPVREQESMSKALRLAYESKRGHVGPVTVKWRELDRAPSADGSWTEEEVARDSRTAARNARTVGYIGEFDSDATKTSVPILNNAGISVVSPASTGVGLTTNEDPGGSTGEPERNYPTGRRTFSRLVPRDTVQAAALVATMSDDGCKKVALADDGSARGASLARLVQREAKDSGVALLAKTTFVPRTSTRALATTYSRQGANCFLLTAGSAEADDARLYRTVAGTLGAKARLYGTDVLCHRSFTTPRKGMPTGIGKRFACVRPTLPVTSPAASSFLGAYRRRWREAPTPYAVYAYEAMRLYLDTIGGLGERGTSKAAVTAALRATKERRSALGSYAIDANGDTTSRVYGLYRVGARGVPRFAGTVSTTVR